MASAVSASSWRRRSQSSPRSGRRGRAGRSSRGRRHRRGSRDVRTCFALLPFPQQRRHRDAEKLPEQIEQRRFESRRPHGWWCAGRRSGVRGRRHPGRRSSARTRLEDRVLARRSTCPTTSGAGILERLRGCVSPPGTSPTPVWPAVSFRITRLRVKNGPCAPLRLSSMLSCPATGMTRISVTRGVEEVTANLYSSTVGSRSPILFLIL